MRYAGPGEGACVAIGLDWLVALYHRPSGVTHLLASPAPEILDALRDGALDRAGLLARLGARFEIDEPDALDDRLAELVAAGLVAEEP